MCRGMEKKIEAVSDKIVPYIGNSTILQLFLLLLLLVLWLFACLAYLVLRKEKTTEKEEIRFHSAVEFHRGNSTGGKWMAFCTQCHMPALPATDIFGDGRHGAMCSGKCGWAVFIPKSLADIIKEL